jgi:hypothetical protein
VGARAATISNNQQLKQQQQRMRQGLNEINTAMTLNRFLACGIVVF